MRYLVRRIEQSSHQLNALRTLTDDDPFVCGLLFVDRLGQVSKIAFCFQTAGNVFHALAYVHQYRLAKTVEQSQLTEHSLERGIVDSASGLYETEDPTF